MRQSGEVPCPGRGGQWGGGGWAHPQSLERESHLLNPPPGSTDPERFATVSIGIGDRVLFHPAPREPRHEWCEVSLRTEAGQFASSDLPWPVRWAIRPPAPSYFADTTQQSQDPSARPACNADTATGPRGTL